MTRRPDPVDVLRAGGVVLAPCPVGYLLAASTAAGVREIFARKGRSEDKPLSVGGWAAAEGLAFLDTLRPEAADALDAAGVTMGLVGRLRGGAPSTPPGVGAAGSVGVFIGLGPILAPLAARARAAGARLFVTSANASGAGNCVLAAQLPPHLTEGIGWACLDDAQIPAAQRAAPRPAPSPMVELGPPVRWLRAGARQEQVAAALAAAGLPVPA